MSPMIKGLSIIIKKYHRINCTVNDEEGYKKKAGKTHGELFADRGCKKLFPGHMQELLVKCGTAKIRQ